MVQNSTGRVNWSWWRFACRATRLPLTQKFPERYERKELGAGTSAPLLGPIRAPFLRRPATHFTFSTGLLNHPLPPGPGPNSRIVTPIFHPVNCSRIPEKRKYAIFTLRMGHAADQTRKIYNGILTCSTKSTEVPTTGPFASLPWMRAPLKGPSPGPGWCVSYVPRRFPNVSPTGKWGNPILSC
ncbi:hypothetical protein BT67DRAFT_287244 [Trichocladium antarcticum]|uniref:Uncharacterized protein n=1 Tax=Trichocladium antarcticum TaxID=1450529 RepID=A0AAN6ZE33_9PEZI|nr:hypothetical protein BT67DRAFT_287244 [Trichocladium antarcticum]